jgi:hypothetical protein
MKLRNLLVPSVLALSSIAMSANAGTLGANSSDSVDVSVDIADLVRVTVEGDITLTHTLGSPSSDSTGICLYRNSDAGVDVTLTSANPDSGNFRMHDGGTSYIIYSVTLGATTFSSGATNGYTDENNSSSTCGGGYSHSLTVDATAVELDGAAAGSYSDTISILVEPT